MSRVHGTELEEVDPSQSSQKLRTVQVNVKRIVNNTVISLAGQLVTWTSTLLLTVAYGRFLGDTKFGELYLAINFVALVGFPLESSFNQQVTRDVAQQPDKAARYLTNTLILKGLLWFAFYGLIILISRLLGYSQEQRWLIIICGATLLSSSTATTLAALHYAFERTVFPVVGTILEKGLAALVGIILLREGADVQVMAFVLLGGSLISMTWQAVWFFRLVGLHFIIDMNLIRQLLRTSIPFLIYGILGVIYYRIDTFLLSLMAKTEVIGWYGAGYRLFDTMVFLPGLIVGTIMYPVFSKLSNTSEETLKLAIVKSMNFLLFCGIPIATVLIAAAPNIIGFLYHNPHFLHTIPVLQALAPGLVFLYANTVATSILISSHQERKITILAAVALAFNLGLNLILIPRYQQVGAAVVTSLTELLLLCVSIVLVPRRLLPVASLKVGVKVIGASLLMAGAIMLLNRLSAQISVFIILLVALVVYLVVAVLLRTIPREDIRALYKSVRRQKTLNSDAPPLEITDIYEREEELQITAKRMIVSQERDQLINVSSDLQRVDYEDEMLQITEKRVSLLPNRAIPEVTQ